MGKVQLLLAYSVLCFFVQFPSESAGIPLNSFRSQLDALKHRMYLDKLGSPPFMQHHAIQNEDISPVQDLRGETGLGRLDLMKRNTELLNDIVVSISSFWTRIKIGRTGSYP